VAVEVAVVAIETVTVETVTEAHLQHR